MSRKDYIKIADTLIDSIKNIISVNMSIEDIGFIKNELIIQFCHMLKSDNSKFDTDKFLEYIDKRMELL